jgi:hypothetical protein
VSILLRLLARPAEAGAAPGAIVGQAEVVETGESTLFRDGPEMLAFLARVTDPGP